LRVDVNGAWSAEEVPRRVAELKRWGVCVVEQPTYGTAAELVDLAGRCELPLMADESLLTAADADVLAAEPQRVWWNIRISKNGGPGPAAALARKAAAAGIPFTIGCMVGESSILSAAQRRLLGEVPQPRFVEGNYGRWLLSGDLARRSLRFGFGGRLRALRKAVAVDERRLQRYGRHLLTQRA